MRHAICTILHRPGFESDVWIGLSKTNEPCACDAMKPDEDCGPCRSNFVWTDGTRATSYHNWFEHEPSSIYQTTCVALPHSFDKWAGLPCSSKSAFICKKGKHPKWMASWCTVVQFIILWTSYQTEFWSNTEIYEFFTVIIVNVIHTFNAYLDIFCRMTNLNWTRFDAAEYTWHA